MLIFVPIERGQIKVAASRYSNILVFSLCTQARVTMAATDLGTVHLLVAAAMGLLDMAKVQDIRKVGMGPVEKALAR